MCPKSVYTNRLRHGIDNVRSRGNIADTSSNAASPSIHPYQPLTNPRSNTNHGPSAGGTHLHTASHHRKSHSLDATTIASHLATQAVKYNKSHQHNALKERWVFLVWGFKNGITRMVFVFSFRCVVPYPPNSEFELELQLDDIVFVHKKRENGWYKGTHSRTGKIGLFPASFVQREC